VPRILLLATTTGYQTRAFSDAAGRLGVDLVFATDRCDRIEDPWQDAAIPIRFHDEPGSVAAILDAVGARPIDGLLVVGDRPTVIAARVAEALGLPWHRPDGAAAARHKRRTRERLRDAGLMVPWFQASTIAAAPAVGGRQPAAVVAAPLTYPCVVKPVALSGSRGVIRADDRKGFDRAVDRLTALLQSPDIRAERDPAHEVILVEAFIPGREYAVEALLDRGALHVLAIFDKPDPLDGPFFEETLYATPSSADEPTQAAISRAIAQAAAALGLSHGPVHAECRVNDGGVFVLEVAARPIGGLCTRALRFVRDATPSPADPAPLEELLLRHALGEDVSGWRREPDASGVMMIPIPRRGTLRGVTGVDDATRIGGIVDVRITAKPDQLLVPLPEGASYLGFIFARGAGAREVVDALRLAHDRLDFRIDPELPIAAVPRDTHLHYNHRHG
jgi:ATP-grasp domain-containing protein/L-aminoacid ligase-like protein